MNAFEFKTASMGAAEWSNLFKVITAKPGDEEPHVCKIDTGLVCAALLRRANAFKNRVLLHSNTIKILHINPLDTTSCPLDKLSDHDTLLPEVINRAVLLECLIATWHDKQFWADLRLLHADSDLLSSTSEEIVHPKPEPCDGSCELKSRVDLDLELLQLRLNNQASSSSLPPCSITKPMEGDEQKTAESIATGDGNRASGSSAVSIGSSTCDCINSQTEEYCSFEARCKFCRQLHANYQTALQLGGCVSPQQQECMPAFAKLLYTCQNWFF